MVEYKCEVCYKIFTKKSNIDNHKKRKNKCKPPKTLKKCIGCSIIIEEDKFTEHSNQCKDLKILELEKRNRELEEKNKELDGKNIELEEKIIIYIHKYNIQELTNKILEIEDQNKKLKKENEELKNNIIEIKNEVSFDKETQLNGFVYIIHLREFINKKEQTYKIGRTNQTITDRLKSYPKNSKLIKFEPVKNPIEIEKQIIKIFKEKFIHKINYGNEYFNGELSKILYEFREVINIFDK